MAAVPFHYLDLRAFCYATEDDRRVESALRTFLPDEFPIDRSRSSGHHGDTILVMSTRVERADEMRTVLDRLLRMEAVDSVADAIADRVDGNCSFHVRLDKQRAFNGEVALGQGIHVRGKVEAYPATRERAIANLEEYLTTST